MKNCICCKYKLYYYPTQLTCTYNTRNPRVRVQVCMGCTKCNLYLYLNTPMTEISQVYPYLCHTLISILWNIYRAIEKGEDQSNTESNGKGTQPLKTHGNQNET